MTSRVAVATIPEPQNWGTFDVEPFEQYYSRWPESFAGIPSPVIETWIYRHWGEFQEWLPLRPLDWRYEISRLSTDEILSGGHVRNWPET